jgi:hypothetical protein
LVQPRDFDARELFQVFPKPDGKRALCQDMVRGLLFSAAEAEGPYLQCFSLTTKQHQPAYQP